MDNLQRIHNKPANLRYHYKQADIDKFIANPDKYRNRSKWQGMDIKRDTNQISRHGLLVIPEEEVEPLLETLYRSPKYGFVGGTKMYHFIKRHYIGISRRQVERWMAGNEVEQIHAQPIKQNVARPIVVTKPLGHVQADLTIWEKYSTKNKNFSYILAVVDLNTKYLWMEPLKRKTAIHCNEALVKILDSMPRMPKIFQTDNGGEFQEEFHKTLEDRGIKHIYSQSHSPTTNGAIERAQQTIKRRIGKHFTLNNTRIWIDVLPDFVEGYNDSQHGTTRHTPKEMLFGGRTSKETEHIQKTGTENIEKRAAEMIKSNTRKFPELHVGDIVRVILTAVDAAERAKELQGQRKSAMQRNWTQEMYEIIKIKVSRKYVTAQKKFKLKDEKGVTVDGWFYRDRLKLQKYADRVQVIPADASEDVKRLDVEDEDEKVEEEDEDENLLPLKHRRRKAQDREDAAIHKIKKKALVDQAAGKSLAEGREKRIRKAPQRYEP